MKSAERGGNTESVWDYPRPPRLEPSKREIQVVHKDVVVAYTAQALRVLETSHPPTYYIPVEDVRMDYLTANPRRTMCEWKGMASYFDSAVGESFVTDVAWTYLAPTQGFSEIAGHMAFYSQKVDACFVDGEKVDAQAGSFYGGWITSDITGPFKGPEGTSGW